MKNLKSLKWLLPSYLKDLKDFFINGWFMPLSNKILSEQFSNGLLDENWPKLLILGSLSPHNSPDRICIESDLSF